MQTIDVIRNNKFIAEFMGGKYDSEKERWFFGATGDPVSEHAPDYNGSWQQLMPVIKKIGNIMYPFDYDSEEYEKFDEIFPETTVITEIFDGDIDSIYLRVIEFIKWYNEQNKNT